MDHSIVARMYTSIGRFFIYLVVSMFFLLLVALGYIRVRGFFQTFRTVLNENVLIVTNHPSWLDIFVLPVLFAPFYILGIPQRIPWSTAAVNIFPPALIPYVKCIMVDRSNKRSDVVCYRQAARLLQSGKSLIIYFEGGRTSKSTEFVEWGGRRIRKTRRSALYLAQDTYTRIIPVYIDFPHVSTPLSMCKSLLHLLRGNCMTIHLGRVSDPIGLTKEGLDHMVLTVGLHQ